MKSAKDGDFHMVVVQNARSRLATMVLADQLRKQGSLRPDNRSKKMKDVISDLIKNQSGVETHAQKMKNMASNVGKSVSFRRSHSPHLMASKMGLCENMDRRAFHRALKPITDDASVPLSEEDLDMIYDSMDINVDERLSLEEFVTTLMATAPRMDTQMQQSCMNLASTFLTPEDEKSVSIDKLEVAEGGSSTLMVNAACQQHILEGLAPGGDKSGSAQKGERTLPEDILRNQHKTSL
eukprot:gnl/MRDRNA2_/MRDRNA2_205601_c0_seq1.p1 gnl/MRDRNA2_/MRDRNA2_205601_c0~~gnl/MRDRNA2_/MRDRNA2_205601_c0_seq1.p1  ORF type:complete len:269 (-),score=54.70 gnl/MRDRNA2_/MRDRNA2_205601_c0_seq1:176-889(-)